MANNLGIQNYSMAILSIIKGATHSYDVWSYLLNGERMFWSLNTAWGIAGEATRGLEGLRWMGDKRYMFGAIRELLINKDFTAKISYLPVSTPLTKCNKGNCGCHVDKSPDIYDNKPEGQELYWIFDNNDFNEKKDEWVTIEDSFAMILISNSHMLGKNLELRLMLMFLMDMEIWLLLEQLIE